MKKLVRTVKEKSNIYITGYQFSNSTVGSTVLITDDYTAFYVSNGLEVRGVSSEGGLDIYDEAEMIIAVNDLMPYFEVDGEYNEDMLFIEDFVGDIYVDMCDDEGESVLKETADIEDHLQFQCEDGNYASCNVILPFKTQMVEINIGKMVKQLIDGN